MPAVSRSPSANKKPSRREREAAAVPGDTALPAKKGSKDRHLRADVFEVPANRAKEDAVCALWLPWRSGLLAEGNVARRDLMAGRALRTTIYASDEARESGIVASKARIGAATQQMVRAQAVGAIASWISNRVNEVREHLDRTYNPNRWRGRARRRFDALPEAARAREAQELAELRHGLYAINAQRAWMAPLSGVVLMRSEDSGKLTPVPARARILARTMFQGIAARHRWPRFERMAMRLDERRGGPTKDGVRQWIEPAHDARHFTWWLSLNTPDGVVDLPIRGWGRDRRDAFGDTSTGTLRPGVLGRTVNICQGVDGRLQAVLTRDVTELLADARAAYRPLTSVLALDFGLTTLFASNHGDLVGRSFMAKLRPLAERASAEAARMQRMGRKPRESAIYQALALRIRGLIDTEVNRAINHLVALHRPSVLVVERLDFRGSGLSRRMNRLLTNCGRGAVAKKLAALAERLGIEVHEVEPAYTSQTCSSCGYVASTNRKGEKFECRHCGMRMHADVNGARNIAALYEGGVASGQAADPETGGVDGRSDLQPSSSPASPRRRKRQASLKSQRPRSITLRDLVRRFDEREPDLRRVSKRKRGKAGARESAPDPRSKNPYWRRFSPLIRNSSRQGRNDVSAVFAAAT